LLWVLELILNVLHNSCSTPEIWLSGLEVGKQMIKHSTEIHSSRCHKYSKYNLCMKPHTSGSLWLTFNPPSAVYNAIKSMFWTFALACIKRLDEQELYRSW
jgi:hypothetical protein